MQLHYRKKEVVIQAFKLDYEAAGKTAVPYEEWPDWLRAAALIDRDDLGAFGYSHFSYCFVVRTLAGPRRVAPGDWIIRGANGELYPCKPDVFEATYEAVDG